MMVLQAVASWPSEQPTVNIRMRAWGCQCAGTTARPGEPAAGLDADQSHVKVKS